jgi:hypothetical protein
MLNQSDSPAARKFLNLATRPLEADGVQHSAAQADLARRIEACPHTNC